jgi:hypothetical protein
VRGNWTGGNTALANIKTGLDSLMAQLQRQTHAATEETRNSRIRTGVRSTILFLHDRASRFQEFASRKAYDLRGRELNPVRMIRTGVIIRQRDYR